MCRRAVARMARIDPVEAVNVPRESAQLFSGAPRFDHKLDRIAVNDVDDPVFAVDCVDEPIADVIGKGVARETEWRIERPSEEALTNRLSVAAKRVADLEHIALVSEVAEMVGRAQEERALPIVRRELAATQIDIADVELERFDEALDITPRGFVAAIFSS